MTEQASGWKIPQARQSIPPAQGTLRAWPAQLLWQHLPSNLTMKARVLCPGSGLCPAQQCLKEPCGIAEGLLGVSRPLISLSHRVGGLSVPASWPADICGHGPTSAELSTAASTPS